MNEKMFFKQSQWIKEMHPGYGHACTELVIACAMGSYDVLVGDQVAIPRKGLPVCVFHLIE